MNSIMISFIITSFAGFATMLGILPIFFSGRKQDIIIPFSLAFSAGVMLSISFFSLIPEATSLIGNIFLMVPTMLFTGIFVVCGILFSSFVDGKIEKKFSSNLLYRVGIVSVIALIFHNIPEGITTFLSSSQDLLLGITLAIGIALHNIPEGISIAIPIYYATYSKKKAVFFTFLSGFSELFGAVLAYLFLTPIITSFGLGAILAMAAGIMIHISVYELLPTAWRYPIPIRIILSFLLGAFIMFFCQMII